jgi:hypothetical protein
MHLTNRGVGLWGDKVYVATQETPTWWRSTRARGASSGTERSPTTSRVTT